MNKNTILIIIVVLVAGAVYFYFFGAPSKESETLSAQVNPQVQISATRVITLLKQIESLRIDSRIFSSAEYQTLRDYTVGIPAVDVGRLNPFAPLPGVSNPATRSTSGSRTTPSSTRR